MQNTLLLAQLQLNEGNQLTIRLLQPAGRPPLCEIQWPERHLVTTTASFDRTISEVMRTLAVASVRLAQLKSERKL